MKINRTLARSVTVSVMGISALALVAGCQTSHRHYAYYSSPSPVIAAGGSENTTTSEYQSGPAENSQAEISATTSNERETVIPLYEESIRTGTREVDAGSVRIRKVVKTETVNEPVTIRRESVTIDREPASGNVQTGSSGQPFQEQEYVIHLKREEPVVEKQVNQIGQVVARKKIDTQQETVQRQIRKDEVAVDKEGNPQNVTISQDVYVHGAQGGASSAEGQSQGQGKRDPNCKDKEDQR
jgi:stress response protein YsnF